MSVVRINLHKVMMMVIMTMMMMMMLLLLLLLLLMMIMMMMMVITTMMMTMMMMMMLLLLFLLLMMMMMMMMICLPASLLLRFNLPRVALGHFRQGIHASIAYFIVLKVNYIQNQFHESYNSVYNSLSLQKRSLTKHRYWYIIIDLS